MLTLTKNASQNFVASVILIVLTSLCVSIRIVIKLRRRQIPQGPDWMCFLGTAVFITYCSLIINFIFNVSETHALDFDYTLGVDYGHNLAKLVYISELLFGLGITAVKLSILWLYHALFSVNPTLRHIIRITTALCILWFLVATLVIALQCMPVYAYWEYFDMPPYCLDYPRVLLGYELSNLLIDVAILCIPTGTVYRLQAPWSKRFPVMCIFLLGIVVCVFSIIRLTAIWHPPHIFRDFNFGGTFLWSTMQLGVAIIVSCLPTFVPLLPLFSKPITYIRAWYNSLRSSPSSAEPGSRDQEANANIFGRASWIKVGNGRRDSSTQRWTHDDDHDDSQYVLDPIPPRRVLVKTSLRLSSLPMNPQQPAHGDSQV